jgi:hypothetical protein
VATVRRDPIFRESCTLPNDLFQLNRDDILQWSDLWPDNRQQRIAAAFSRSLTRRFFTLDRIFRSTLICRALVECLTKREVKSVNSRIEELDFEGSVYDGTFLPDELIEPGLSNFAGAVRGRVNAAIFAGSGAIQPYDKAYWLGVLRGSQHQVQVATVEPEDDLSGHCLEHGALGIDVPRPAQTPMI